MTRKDIIRMAQEVELINKDYDFAFLNKFTDKVERFAALVASAERERLTDSAMKAAEKAVDVAIALEREACAKVCEEHGKTWEEKMLLGFQATLDDAAKAIRARGQA